MSLSKRARQGIGIFNKINQSGKRWSYSAKRMKVSPPGLPENVIDAAKAAMAALPEGMRNAYIPELSKQSDDAQPQTAKGGAQQSVSGQPENGQETQKGTTGGPQCGE